MMQVISRLKPTDWQWATSIEELKKAALAFLISVTLFWALAWGLKHFLAFDPMPVRCMPWKFYVVNPFAKADHLEHLDLVVFDARTTMWVPGKLREEQPYLGKKIIKMVAALPGDRVRITASEVYINGQPFSAMVEKRYGFSPPLKGLNPSTVKKLGRSVESFERSFVVSADHLFVLGTESRSFDGRYWGQLPAYQVEGKAYAIW